MNENKNFIMLKTTYSQFCKRILIVFIDSLKYFRSELIKLVSELILHSYMTNCPFLEFFSTTLETESLQTRSDFV